MADLVYVFDLDDTLYLERDYVRSGFHHVGEVVSALYGVDGVSDFAWALFNNGVRGNTFNLLVDHFELPDRALGVLVSEYRDHNPVISLQPDVPAFLRASADAVVGTGLVTDGYGSGQWRTLRALGIADVIDNIVVTDDHGSEWTKPSTLAFDFIQSRFPRPGTEFVYFADNPIKDFDAPLQLGWKTVRVRRELGLHYLVDDRVAVHETIPAFSELRGETASAQREVTDDRGDLR